MSLLNVSRVIALIAVIILLNLVFFLGFLFAVFGFIRLFEFAIIGLNFVLGGLTLKAALLTRRPGVLTGLEIIIYGVASLSAWFVINSLALLPAGLILLAGGLYMAGVNRPRPQRPPYYR